MLQSMGSKELDTTEWLNNNCINTVEIFIKIENKDTQPFHSETKLSWENLVHCVQAAVAGSPLPSSTRTLCASPLCFATQSWRSMSPFLALSRLWGLWFQEWFRLKLQSNRHWWFLIQGTPWGVTKADTARVCFSGSTMVMWHVGVSITRWKTPCVF